MRPNGNRRPRGRGGGGGSGGGGGGGGGGGKHHRPPNRNQSFDSSGPDVRVRGNAHQIFDKYQALGREAAASGDRILAESYYQHAEHYFRLIQQMGGFQPHRDNRMWGDEEMVEGQGQGQGQGNGQGQGAPSEDGPPEPTVTPLVQQRPHDPAQQDQPDIGFEPIANRGND